MKKSELVKNTNQRYFKYLFVLLILILVIIVFYFKKILNKPIPIMGSILISNSYAQDDIPKKVKTKIMKYEDLLIDEVLFPIKFSLTGFSILPTKSNAPDSCDKMNLFSTKLALLTFPIKFEREDWKKYIEKCSFEFNKKMSAMLELKSKKIKSKSELMKFLGPYKFSDGTKRIIISTFEKKRSRRKDEKELSRFIEISKGLNLTKEIKEKYFAIEKYKEQGVVKNNFFANLINLRYALTIKNFSWAKSILIDLVYYNKLRFINDVQDHYFENEKQVNEFKEEFLKTIELAYNSLQYKELIQILVNKYVEIFGTEDLNAISENVSANWSLVEIREKASSITFGRQFPDFWYNQLLERTTKFELDAFLIKNMKKRNVHLIPLHSYGVFFNYIPKDEGTRELIIDKILEFSKKGTCYSEDLVLYLLQSDVIKRKISLKNKKYSSAYFNLKREHHRKCLKQGIGIKFQLYNLLLLGDKDENLLWWLVL
jgi:hypothetical protein